MKHLSGAPHKGKLLTFPANITMPEGNALAYLKTLVNYGRRKFCIIGPRKISVISVINNVSDNRLKNLS